MKLFAISDLHFGIAVEKPMTIFGDVWEDHMTQIKNHWLHQVNQEDIVLIPGDISWGINIAEAKPDLDFISRLPGDKIFIRGNHDYWWSKVGKLNTLYDNMYFLQNNAYRVREFVICGTRGFICPNEECFSEEDEKIYKRELIRLELSLKAAKEKGAKEIIAMLHYAPTSGRKTGSGFTRLFEMYGVKHVIYGHLHGDFMAKDYLEGEHSGVNYHLVSADYLEFCPYLLAVSD